MHRDEAAFVDSPMEQEILGGVRVLSSLILSATC